MRVPQHLAAKASVNSWRATYSRAGVCHIYHRCCNNAGSRPATARHFCDVMGRKSRDHIFRRGEHAGSRRVAGTVAIPTIRCKTLGTRAM